MTSSSSSTELSRTTGADFFNLLMTLPAREAAVPSDFPVLHQTTHYDKILYKDR